MKRELQYEVTEEEDGLRLDQYIAGRCMDLSRSYIQKLIKESRVTINKNIQTKESRMIRNGPSGILLYINGVKNYLRLAIKLSTSSRVGMTLKAPLRVVMRDAAALAKVRSSLRFSSVRFSRPWSRT